MLPKYTLLVVFLFNFKDNDDICSSVFHVAFFVTHFGCFSDVLAHIKLLLAYRAALFSSLPFLPPHHASLSLTMEVEHRPKQVKQRPSRLSLSSQNMADLSILSPRTPKSIGKPSSRRQSVVEQLSTISRRSSTASSVIAEFANPPGQPFTPNLLSESISYFPDESTTSPPTGRSRSCSLTSLANITGLASSDGHTLYKVKTTKTNRKLNNFFGEQPPLDICVREIRKEGLKALLQSKVPLCYFLYHLLEEFSSENLVRNTDVASLGGVGIFFFLAAFCMTLAELLTIKVFFQNSSFSLRSNNMNPSSTKLKHSN